MKTPETALTEWACDDIKFDYQQGKGPQGHNRDQFKALCEDFRNGIGDASVQGSGGQTHAVSGLLATTVNKPRSFIGDLADWRTLSSVKSAVDTFTLIMGSKVQQDDLPTILDQYFTPMNLLRCQTIQEVVTGLMQKAKL